MTYPIPRDALDYRLGIVGTSGSGKTYAMLGAVEALLAKKARAILIDALGVCWGLRLMADGKTPSGLDVVIFGGPHGDMPINDRAGALIGEAVATMKESAIIDLSELGSAAAERRFMLAFLTSLYKHATKEPVHLILDEADLWAPQRILDREGEAMKLLGVVENVVRRGRIKGFIPWLITQRPAVVNKNVLSQVDGLVAFLLTSSQDRDALGAWVEGQADKGVWPKLYADLATYPQGDALIWLPRTGVLKIGHFPERVTFDSSRTPKRGEKAVTRTIPPLDVDALKKKLAKVEAEAKENDPKALKAEIERLRREASAQKNAPASIKMPDVKAIRQQGYTEGLNKGRAIAISILNEIKPHLTEMAKRLERATTGLYGSLDRLETERGANQVPISTLKAPVKNPRIDTSDIPERGKEFFAKAKLVEPTNGSLPGPLQKIIDAVVWWKAFGIVPTKQQIGYIAGYKPRGGSWDTYVSRLRSMGLMEKGSLRLTAEGYQAAHPPEALPSGDALRERVMEKLTGPQRKIATPIIQRYPEELSKDEAGQASGYQPRGGSWDTYLSQLRSLEIIERGRLKAQDWLFP